MYDFFGDFFAVLRLAVLALVVALPFAIWKLIEVGLWLWRHIDFSWT